MLREICYIHRNERSKAASSREWEQIHEKAWAKPEVGTWNLFK